MPGKRLTHSLICLTAATLVILLAAAPAQAVIYINNDATGGQCQNIGVWDWNSKTCTLTQDPATGEYIDILADDVTLDGNGHTITGSNLQGTGVDLTSRYGVVIKNLRIENYNYGLYLKGGTSGQPNIIQGNTFFGNKTASMLLELANYNHVTGNRVDSQLAGVFLSASSSNLIRNNVIDSSFPGLKGGMTLSGSSSNTISGNTFDGNLIQSVYIASDSNNNFVYANNFMGMEASDYGSNNLFYLSIFSAHWGNFWRGYDSPGEGCNNNSFDEFCDAAVNIEGSSPAADNYPHILRGGWNRFDFTYYDNQGGTNWILMANPDGAPEDLWMDLSIAGADKTLPALPGLAPGQIPPNKSIAAIYPGLKAGPVEVFSRSLFSNPIVSQRTLWPAGGSSMEEVPGTNAYRLSDKFMWPWYDMKSPGFKDWILVSNPNDFAVDIDVWIGIGSKDWSTTIDAGDQQVWTSPGYSDGPVYLDADISGTNDPAKVMASQRVLSNGDKAFNEVPGTPETELSDYYYWTWYDMASPGAQNWIMIGNPQPFGGPPIYYDIYIDGQMVNENDHGPISSWTYVARQFPGQMDGPVEVLTYYAGGAPAKSLASQRSIWGPSFEEVPGLDYYNLSSSYDWTWYDQKSPGAQNWVMVSNPNDFEITATVQFSDETGTPVLENFNIPADGDHNFNYPGNRGGPVKVSAVRTSNGSDADVVASQRVLWNGYFNEVWGQ